MKYINAYTYIYISRDCTVVQMLSRSHAFMHFCTFTTPCTKMHTQAHALLMYLALALPSKSLCMYKPGSIFREQIKTGMDKLKD